MKEWVGTAKSEEEAIALGLKKLGLSPEQVDTKVLSDRTSGLLSLFGFRQVKVRIVEKARRLERRERTENGDEYDRSSHSLEYRRPGPKGRRDDRTKEQKPVRSNDQGRRNSPAAAQPAARPDDRRRGESTRPLPAGPPSDKNPHRKSQRPSFGGQPSGQKPFPPERPLPLKERRGEPKRSSFGVPGSFHPPVLPETLLAQWKTLLGWDDLAWDMTPAENHRLTVTLKTSQGERLAGNGGRALEAFEYLFNMASSSGDREKTWVSFRVAGFPSAEESRVVDKALFAAFQVRRTAKPFHLEPMSPGQRRAVHQTLIHHPDVETASEGAGAARHVVVKPKENK